VAAHDLPTPDPADDVRPRDTSGPPVAAGPRRRPRARTTST